MGVPTSYLPSTKNLSAILEALRKAKAPDKFTYSFLDGLGFQSSNDRYIIGVLKDLGFLDTNGKPQDSYFQYLDETRSKIVLAQAIEVSYASLFEVNKNAELLDTSAVREKLKTLTQGTQSETVYSKMASTFTTLCKLADFSSARKEVIQSPFVSEEAIKNEPLGEHEKEIADTRSARSSKGHRIAGFAYNISIVLPDTRDKAVYDVLFKSLREHLLDD